MNSSFGNGVRGAMLVLALGCVLGAAADVGWAQSTAVPRTLAGTWVHDGELERDMRTVEAAFAPSIRSVPEILHGLARERIRTEMEPPRRVLVALEGERVRVTLVAGRTTVVHGPLGARASVSGGDGSTRITPRLSSGWLELRYEGEGSELRQLYSTEQDGSRMHLDHTVTSPRLPSPVRYRLEYVRPRP